MSIHKITPFLSDIKTFFKNSDMTAAMQNISFILSVARRFSDYETIGGLFREISRETVQLSVAQQIWGILQELVTAIARVFGLLDEEIYDAIINQSDEIAHIAQFYNLKSAS